MRKLPISSAHFSLAFKITAGFLSVLAALATIIPAARQSGMIGPLTLMVTNVAHIRLTPLADTAWALGDTLHFAALASDTNGVALTSPSLIWTVTNTEVAEAHSDGSVISTGPGETSVLVTSGRASAQALVVVHPRAVALKPSTDTIDLPEGASTSLIAVPYDLRGRVIRGTLARWRSLDTTIVRTDSLGLATGIVPGLVAAEAHLDGARAQLIVRVTPVLGAVAVISGTDQHAPASTPLPAPVVVRTLSRQGRPLGGILLRAVADAGRLESDTVRTGADGQARFRWTLGDRPGPQRFGARADELDSLVVAVAEADPAERNTRFELVDPLGTGPAGAPLPGRVVIRLEDTLGQVLPNVPVRWVAQDGSRIATTAARSDSLGLVSATWTLGPKMGRNRARLIAGPGSAPSFALETRSVAGAPKSLTVLSGDRQRGQVAKEIIVRVRAADAQGNPVAGAVLQGDPSAGTVTSVDSATAEDGTLRLRWSLGPLAGEQTLEVRAGDARAHLVATALPAPAARVDIVTPTIAIVSSAKVRVVAVVTDSLGNPIQGNVVQLRASAGSVSPARATSDARGRATFTWTLARRAGEQTITVHAVGVRTDATKTVRRPNSR